MSRRTRRLPLLASLIAVLLAAAAPGALAADSSDLHWERVANLPRPSYITSGSGDAPEILDVSPDGLTMTSTVGDTGWASFDISDLEHPQQIAKGNLGGHATSINYTPDGKYFLLTGKGAPNYLAVYDANTFARLRAFTLPAGPDSTAISPDGKYAITGIEDENNAGVPGSLVVFDLKGAPSAWSVRNVAIPPDPAMAAATDPQPEFIDIAPDNVAAVTLQENNAVLMLDVAKAEIIDIWGTGSTNQLADLSDDETPSLTEPFTAPREPDEVAFTADGQHLLMANEGEGGDGGRSVTVFDRDGNLAWDSGNSLEQALAVRGLYPDDRSGDRGSEFEGVDTAVIDGVPWGVVGAERGDALIFLDLTDPAQPRLAEVAATLGTEPEGVLFVPQRRLAISPDAGRPFGWSFFELRGSAETEAHRQLIADQPWLGVGGLGTDGAGNPVVLTAGEQQRLLEARDGRSAPAATIALAGTPLHLDPDNPQPFPEADDVAIDPDRGVAWVVGPAEPPTLFRLDGDGTANPLPLPDPPGDNGVIPRGIAFSPDGSTLYVASNDVLPAGSMASVWTLFARDQATGAFRTFAVTIPNGQNTELRDAAVTPDGDPVLMVVQESETKLLRVPLATATPAGAVAAVPAGSVPDGAYGERGPSGMAIGPRGELIVVGAPSELSIDPNRFPRTDAEPGAAEGLPSPANPSLPDVSPLLPARASARVGSRLFVSSAFSSGPWEVSTETTGTELNGVDGVPSGPAFAGGTVLTSVPDGQGGTYAGGNFTTVGGVARSGLVHLLPDGTVDPAFNPAPDGKVTSLLRLGSTLFVGGDFTQISGVARTRFAALSAVDGTPVPGFAEPAPETGPRAMAFDAGHLYLGGSFQTLGGAPHHGIGRIDAATGVVDGTWSPQLAGASGSVEALLVGPEGLYLGGEWTGVNASTQRAVVLLSTSDGAVDTGFAPSFQFASPGRFGGFALRGEQLYLVTGNALVGLDTQQRVGRVDASTGAVDLGFRVPPRIVQNVTTAGIAPLLLRGGWLYVGHANGGEFSTRRIARVDAGTGAIDPAWTPALTAESQIDVRTLSSTDGGVFAGGDYVSAGIQRGVGVYDLGSNRFLPHLGAGTAIPSLMAAAGGWVYTLSAGTLGRLDPATGRPDPGYQLDIIGSVSGISAAQGKLYVGGVSFVDGEPRDGVAAIDGESGELLKGFLPRIDGSVELVSAHGDTVYVAGDLTAVDGAPRSRLAALDGSSGGSRASFQEPVVPGDAMLTGLLAGSGGLYLTGFFTEIGGQPHAGIARLDPVSGTATAGFSPTFAGQPESIAEHGGHLLVAGYLADAPAEPLTASLRALDELSGATVPGFIPAVSETAGMLSFGTRLLVMSSEGDVAYRSFDVATPENVTPPSLAGLLRQGEPVTCLPGTWDNSPTGFTYAWSVDGSAVAGETAATYTPRDGDLGHELTCAVQAGNQAGTSAAAVSAAAPVVLGVPQSTAAPLLSGTPAPGQTLHCSPGAWSRSPSGFAYRWLRDGAELPDVQADRVVSAADSGHQLACRVTASNAAGESAPQVSNQLGVPAPAPPVQVVPPAPAPPTTQPPAVSPDVKKKTKKAPCKGKRGKKRKACIKKHGGKRQSNGHKLVAS